jgi:hypothetical protein
MVIVSTKFSDLTSRIVARSFFNSSPAIQSKSLGVLLVLVSVTSTFLFFYFFFLFEDLKEDVTDATDTGDNNARPEGAIGDSGRGKSVNVAVSD